MSIIPVLLLGFFSSYYAAAIVQQEVDRNHQTILRQFQYQINSLLKNLEKDSLSLASNIVIEKSVEIGPVNKDLGQTFEAIDTVQKLRSYSDINIDISLVYNKYHKVFSTQYGYIDESDFPYKDLLKKVDMKYNSGVVIPPNSNLGQNELLLMRPVPTFFVGTPDGMLVLHVQTDRLTEFLNQVELGDGRRLLVIDDQGTIVISKDQREIGTRLTPSSEIYQFWSDASDGGTGKITLNGVAYNLSVQKSSFNHWTYIAMTPTKELTRKAKNIQYFTWALAALLAGLWILVSLIGSNRLYFPIGRLLQMFSGEAKQGQENGIQALETFIRQMVKTNDHLKQQLSEQLPYLKETVFQQLLRGEMSDQEIRKKTEHYGFPLKGSWFYVCLVDVDEYVAFQKNYREKDRSLMLYALRKMVEEICEEAFSCITVTPLPGQIAVIIGVDKAGEATDSGILSVAEQFREKVRQFFQFTVTVAVSEARKDYRGISDAYQEAGELLGYRLLMGYNVVISKNSIEPAIKQSGRSLLKWQKQIVTDIAKGDIEQAKAHLSQMIQVIPQYVRHSEAARGLFAYLLGELEALLQEWNPELHDFYGEDFYKQLYGMTSLEEVKGWLENSVFPAVVSALQDASVPKQKKLVQQVLFYIHERFETDLSLQQIADEFHISPSQLSRMFKEETGYAFGDYLIDYRMNKAKEWLAHTEMPIKEIAERLRYTTVQNFSRIFKQVADMPPGQYRKQYRGEKS